MSNLLRVPVTLAVVMAATGAAALATTPATAATAHNSVSNGQVIHRAEAGSAGATGAGVTGVAAKPRYRFTVLDRSMPGGVGTAGVFVSGMSSNGVVAVMTTEQRADRPRFALLDRGGSLGRIRLPRSSGCTLTGVQDVNASRAVLASGMCKGRERAFVVDARGRVRQLPTPKGLTAASMELNDRGDVIGSVFGGSEKKPVSKSAYWPASGGVVLHDQVKDTGYPWALSNTGIVVGSNARSVASWAKASTRMARSIAAPPVTAYGGDISPDGTHIVASRQGASFVLRRGAPARPLARGSGFEAQRVNDSGRVVGLRYTGGGYLPAVADRGVAYNLKGLADIPDGWQLWPTDIANNGDIAAQAQAPDGSQHAALLVARR
ncbi:hypothetical protein [Piscicoccus intestinalis]|uniref:hypothetical protein n=1 Tax=Piscicoccus intestinalis TaxID=746033 RepID=UPI0012ED3D6C|nr:hypothetical protein [Piscicoccus intestinalis]